MNPHTRLLGVVAVSLLAEAAEAEVDHALASSVVQIQAHQPTAARVSLGSGVVVGPGRVATNCHVTQQAKAITVSKGALRFRASSQRADVERDLCLLEVPGLSVPAAKLGRSSRLAIGDIVYLYGYPRALGMAFSQGQVQSLHAFKHSVVIETSVALIEGASGGGLFDGAGRLMGLATFFSAGHSGRNYAIPADWIAGLVSKAPRGIEPMQGIPFWQDVKHLPGFLRVPGR